MLAASSKSSACLLMEGFDSRSMRATYPAFAVDVGDSVAIAGACMTAIRVDGGVFAVDTSKESLARTSGLDAPGEVNIETSVRVGDSLGGPSGGWACRWRG